MAAVRLTSYQFDEAGRIECPACGWSGTAAEADTDYFAELFDASCPRCEKMLLIVSYPTIDETKAEAARGNPLALEEWPGRRVAVRGRTATRPVAL